MTTKNHKELTLFNLPEGREAEAISALEALKVTPGWKFIKEVLEANIKAVEDIILDGEDGMTAEELQKWRDRRYYQKELLDTPQFIIDKIQGKRGGKESIILDPYDKIDNTKVKI